MRIAFLDAKTLGNLKEISLLKHFGDVSIYETTSADDVVARIKESDIVITNKVVLNAKTLSQAPQLKLICIAATGTNNVDLEYCRQAGIEVKNAVGYSTKSVAQFTFNCLLYFIHRTHYYEQYVKSGKYVENDIFTHIHHDFFELNCKRFGIIGLGNIGREVAKLAEAFGATVCYYSTSGKNTNQDYDRVTLDELLSNCDVVSIHSPLDENTKSLIGEAELKKMKKEAIIINMGRGGIIDEVALADALNNNWIRGAITDVLSREPIEKNNPLLDLHSPEKVLITPHIAWASLEARKKLLQIIIRHIQEFQEGINSQRGI